MERSPPPKILRLAPDSEFVSSLRPHFILQLSFVSLFHPTFFIKALEGIFAHCLHALDVLPALIIPGGFFNRSLLTLFSERQAHYTYAFFPYVFFFTIICIDMT